MSNLTRNWAFQSSPAPENGGDGDTELVDLENTTIEELEAEFNRLQATPAANSQDTIQHIGSLSGETPPFHTAPRDAQS